VDKAGDNVVQEIEKVNPKNEDNATLMGADVDSKEENFDAVEILSVESKKHIKPLWIVLMILLIMGMGIFFSKSDKDEVKMSCGESMGGCKREHNLNEVGKE
jgi:hypothetical protein